MSDYKGYWFDKTSAGCGNGEGFRDGSSENAVGAYCCHISPLIQRTYARDSSCVDGVCAYNVI